MASSFPQAVQDISQQLYDVADRNMIGALTAIAGIGIHDRTSAMYAAVMAAAPSVRFISGLIAEAGEDGEKANVYKKELALVAGLILGRMIQSEADGIRVDFTPRNVLAAIEAASKVAGYDVKSDIDHKMLASYQGALGGDGSTAGGVSLGYWDYIPEVGQSGPDFSDLGEKVVDFGNFSKTRH